MSATQATPLGARTLPSKREGGTAKRGQTPFLPTLFDRLLDDEPSQKTESPEAFAMTRSQMRAIMQRDLAYLLNTINAESWIDRLQYPTVAASTLNFGVPSVAGGYLSAHKWVDIELMIRTAVLDFEPRIMASSLLVKPLLKDGAQNHYNVLLFEISGLVSMQPYPMEFMVQSAVDLETSRITVQ